jgi:pimeloyl-ACP methyl ester carboxylesterase
VNWVDPGWIAILTQASRRAIALDLRGHGGSTKLYDPADYNTGIMADDVRALMDHLALPTADIMGYSLGARIAAVFARACPRRARSLILGGLGSRLIDGNEIPVAIAEGMEAPTLAEVIDPAARAFRAFAEQTGSDLAALAACIRGSRQALTPQDLATIEAETLIAVGTEDAVAGSAHALAALMPNARVLDIPGRDHMRAVGDRVFKQGVIAFLAKRD